jgi:hypothetical protein
MAAQRFSNDAVRGLADVRKAFQAAPAIVQQHMGAATEKSTFAILQRARARVRVRHGFLKQALDWSFSQKTGEGRIGVRRGARFNIPGTRRFNGKHDQAFPARYGHLLEFGHGGPHPAAPQPFMIPAAEAEREAYVVLCREAGRAIERDMVMVTRTGTEVPEIIIGGRNL